MQLVAYGAQDIYLTGNPQITFFKVVYRRHTNFSMETIQQTLNGTPASGGSSTVTISRNGDLVYKVYVCSADGSGADGTITNGSELVNKAELEIGGQLIDRQTAEWMQIWNELSTTESKASALKSMQGDIGVNGGDLTQAKAGVSKIQVPLLFWFCRNPGLALPLIALQYHEVKIKCTWGATATVGGGIAEAEVWVDYIYLDTDERRRFAQVSHEYLIEQVQIQAANGNASNKLNFNHPVKELIWTNQIGANYGTAQLKLNGHDRFAARDWRYFSRTQVWQHHTGAGGLASTAGAGVFNDGIGVYSFALKPEEHQPSGTCNFSRIDNAQMVQTTDGAANMCFAVNYNVLRIMSGMGGLAYSN
jgi:hypothetical protein